jgi:ABC-2 type transport system ATP-binding protein
MGQVRGLMSMLALDVENLVKIYRKRRGLWSYGREVRAVDGLSFSVKRGQIFGLLGPNGAGKTTTLKVLTTLIRPTNGRAQVMGIDVLERPLDVRRTISVVLQETAVEMFLTARDNLLTFARFHGMKGRRARDLAEEVMRRFQILEEADRKVQDLSGGFRRRVQVAKVFLAETPLVFLDEFSTGMDPILKREVMNMMREETARGRTFVLTTQILGEAEELCDEILIINRGKQVARGDLHTLKLLSENVYEVSLTFDSLPVAIVSELESMKPMRLNIVQNTVEMALKAEEARVLELVSELAKRGRVLRVEVSGASLEDIFVELTREK